MFTTVAAIWHITVKFLLLLCIWVFLQKQLGKKVYSKHQSEITRLATVYASIMVISFLAW